MNKEKIVEVMASVAGIPTWKAEAAFQALLKQLPVICEVTENNMGGLHFTFETPAGELYQELLNMRGNP